MQRRIGQLIENGEFTAMLERTAVDEMIAQAEETAAESEIEPYERFSVVETDNGYAIWDDIHDGYYTDDKGVTEEFLSEWQAEAYLEEVRKAVSDKEPAEWLYVERAKIEPEAETKSTPEMTTETVAVYPGEKNHLPYDIVIQTLYTGEPEHTPPTPTAENFISPT